MMYDEYNARFEAKLKDLGEDFARRVALYKAALVDVQTLWQLVRASLSVNAGWNPRAWPPIGLPRSCPHKQTPPR